jgi:hypothetical protein
MVDISSLLILAAVQGRAAVQDPATAAVEDPAPVEDPAVVQEDLYDDSGMWKTFLDEVEEEDSRFTDAWKEDANSIVVFASLQLVPLCSSQ